MNDRNYDASKFAFELRLKIWEELFGFDKADMIDPISESLWIKIQDRAKVYLFFH